MNCAGRREMDSARFSSRARRGRAGAAMPGAVTVALLQQYRRSLRAPFIVERIGESPAALFEKPKRHAEDHCENRARVIRSKQLQFSERRPVKTAFRFWWRECVHRPASFTSNFRSAASTDGR